jgi:hypothetical protein
VVCGASNGEMESKPRGNRKLVAILVSFDERKKMKTNNTRDQIHHYSLQLKEENFATLLLFYNNRYGWSWQFQTTTERLQRLSFKKGPKTSFNSSFW